ncbi:MAG: hypothetical protein E6G86_18400 [Alphaproteobacteria bacterium]|nr:MAG: hypothetical protein E6G86_18400 [Alphaproteobacteria bacterium]
MTRIVNTGAILLGLDLALEIAADALELAATASKCAPPPCSLREARRDNEFPPPRNIAQGVDILAQDSLLLPYLDDAAGKLLRKTNSAAPRPRMSYAIAPRFLTSCLPASLIIRSSLWDVSPPGRSGQNFSGSIRADS